VRRKESESQFNPEKTLDGAKVDLHIAHERFACSTVQPVDADRRFPSGDLTMSAPLETERTRVAVVSPSE
jgi:hypothetical protein